MAFADEVGQRAFTDRAAEKIAKQFAGALVRQKLIVFEIHCRGLDRYNRTQDGRPPRVIFQAVERKGYPASKRLKKYAYFLVELVIFPSWENAFPDSQALISKSSFIFETKIIIN